MDIFSSDLFEKISQQDRRDNKPEDNPIISHKKVKRRAKKYEKNIASFYRDQKRLFRELLASYSQSFFGLIYKIDLTIEQWLELVDQLIDEEQTKNLLVDQFVFQELPIAFAEILKNTVIEYDLEFPTGF
jgi:hypothetical protein